MCIVANILRKQKQFSSIRCVLGKLYNGNVHGIKSRQWWHGVIWKQGSGILKPFFSSITFCSLQWIPRRLYFAFLNYHLREVVHMQGKRMPSFGREINCLIWLWMKDMKITRLIGKYVKYKFLNNSFVLNHRVMKESWKNIYSPFFMSNYL